MDMRTYTAARLLALNRRKTVGIWLKQWVQGAKKKRISAFDKRLLDKLIVQSSRLEFWSAGPAERALRGVNQVAQGSIDGLLVGKMLSDVW